MSLGEPVRDFYGKIIAFYDYQSNGDIVVRAFSGIILGKYDKAMNVTRDFYGRIVARGNAVGMLIKPE